MGLCCAWRSTCPYGDFVCGNGLNAILSPKRYKLKSKKKAMNKTRGFLYTLARLLGDISAVKKGRVGKRVGRRVVGRKAGRGIGKLFR